MNTQTELAKIEQRAKIKRVTGKTLTYFFLSVWGIFVLFPFYWMILTSVKSYSAYNAEYTPKFWTMAPTLENYRAAFDGFDPEVVASYDEEKISLLMQNPGIIRNRLKIRSAVTNAKAFLKVQEEFGSFDAYLWSFTQGKQIDGHWKTPADIPTESDVSKRMAADMKKRGIGFVGPVITYSFLQSIGIVNDHLEDCEYR